MVENLATLSQDLKNVLSNNKLHFGQQGEGVIISQLNSDILTFQPYQFDQIIVKLSLRNSIGKNIMDGTLNTKIINNCDPYFLTRP